MNRHQGGLTLKSKTGEPESRLEVIKKRRRRRRISSLILLVLCLLLTFNIEGIVSAVRGVFNIGGAQFHSVATMKYVKALKEEDAFAVQRVGNRVIKAEGGKLQAYDGEGKMLWEKAYGGSTALFAAVGNRIFLVERNSGDFFILDENGNVKVKREALGKIDRVIAKKEDKVILYKALEKKIQVLDGKGDDVTTIDLPYPEILDLDFAPDLDLIGVSVFFVEKDYFHSNVFMFGLDGKMVGARSFNSQILHRLSGYKDQFIGMTDQGLQAFSDKDEEIWHVTDDRVINRLDYNAAGYEAVNFVIEDKALDEMRDENMIAVFDPQGKKVFENKVPMIVEKIYLGDNRLALIGDNQVVLMDFEGRKLGKKTLEKGLKNILWINDKNIGLEYADRFEWYRLSY